MAQKNESGRTSTELDVSMLSTPCEDIYADMKKPGVRPIECDNNSACNWVTIHGETPRDLTLELIGDWTQE